MDLACASGWCEALACASGWYAAVLDAEQAAGLIIAGRGLAVLAGRHARQGNKLPPAEGGPGGRKFLGGRPVVLLRVQGAVFADCVLEQQVKHRTGRMALLAIVGHHRARMRLGLVADRIVEFLEELLAVGGLDLGELLFAWIRLPVQEVAAASQPVLGNLVGSQNQTRLGVPGVADA